jgi:hypothetical protein
VTSKFLLGPAAIRGGHSLLLSMDLFGRPYIEELRGNEALTSTLSAVTAGCGWSLVQSNCPALEPQVKDRNS